MGAGTFCIITADTLSLGKERSLSAGVLLTVLSDNTEHSGWTVAKGNLILTEEDE